MIASSFASAIEAIQAYLLLYIFSEIYVIEEHTEAVKFNPKSLVHLNKTEQKPKMLEKPFKNTDKLLQILIGFTIPNQSFAMSATA